MAVDITVRFVCGHELGLESDTAIESVQCAECGERRVRSVVAPKPRIRATECDAQSPLIHRTT